MSRLHALVHLEKHAPADLDARTLRVLHEQIRHELVIFLPNPDECAPEIAELDAAKVRIEAELASRGLAP